MFQSQVEAVRIAQKGRFKWHGCDEDIRFGLSFVRRFADAQEHNTRDIKAITSRHNNRVGRYVRYIIIRTIIKDKLKKLKLTDTIIF